VELAFSHILEIPGKRRLAPEQAAVVQQKLYVGYRLPAAVIELGALLATAVTTIVVHGRGAQFLLSIAALGAMFGSMVVFVLVTDRQNEGFSSGIRRAFRQTGRGRARWEVSQRNSSGAVSRGCGTSGRRSSRVMRTQWKVS